jgi:hypothetical protein
MMFRITIPSCVQFQVSSTSQGDAAPTEQSGCLDHISMPPDWWRETCHGPAKGRHSMLPQWEARRLTGRL